ncbi:MAG TPA: SHOCT domain-containing protein [Acidimicrobiia bacterium]|nr:SHOCT domain-containing protein [Acidimicrobiia bacterium]
MNRAGAHINSLTLQVAPDGEAPFEVVLKETYPEMSGGPTVGSAVGVLYDPNDHSKVVVDPSTAGLAARVAGTMSPASRAAFEQSGGGSAEELLQDRITDPAAFQQRLQQRAATAAPAERDPADEIAKLADLRDRGALTDEESQTQKKKVLGT